MPFDVVFVVSPTMPSEPPTAVTEPPKDEAPPANVADMGHVPIGAIARTSTLTPDEDLRTWAGRMRPPPPRATLGVMATPPITIQPPTPSGARPVIVHINNRDERLGLAHSDHDLIVFLADAGLKDPKRILDNPAVVRWQGAAAHRYETA
ncbi:hypothetical protein [Streptomyces sp. NPDC057582]|uniref:hypothetical protein n=1 Tax=unclassified Streptomyces TaxID=2593676 RepID=UPI0036CF68BF